MKCPRPQCSETIRDFEAICPACGAHVSVPNVRYAMRQEEHDALSARLAAAVKSATARGCAPVLARFRQAVQKSNAVICRDLSIMQVIASNDSQLYATFYQSVRGGSRRPETNEFDGIRTAVDSMLFPHYFTEICFAALTLDECGLAGYGNCSAVFKDAAIEDRATVFEENAIFFFNRHRILAGQPPVVPFGYRATWRDRDQLATAKLEASLNAHTRDQDFAGILLKSSKDRKSDDFVEVHIFGTLSRQSFAKMVIQKSGRKADNVLAEDLRRKLKGTDIKLEIR